MNFCVNGSKPGFVYFDSSSRCDPPISFGVRGDPKVWKSNRDGPLLRSLISCVLIGFYEPDWENSALTNFRWSVEWFDNLKIED